MTRIVIAKEASPLPPGESVALDLSPGSPFLGELLRTIAGTEVRSLRVTEAASKQSADREVTVQSASGGARTSLYDLLELVIDLAGPEIGWDVVDGTLWIATWDELAARGTSFEFALDDLLIVPADHGSPVPYPIFEQALTVAELRSLLTMHLQQAFHSIEVVGTERSLVVVHTPRVLREIQSWLDAFRAFRAPLPEAGVPGRTHLIARRASDEVVIRALEVEGGPERIVTEQGESLKERWRRFGEQHGVTVLWTAGALAIDAQRSASIERGDPLDESGWAIRLEVCGGALLIRAPHESCSARTLSTAFFDLRLVLTGGAATAAQMRAHPALARLEEDGRTLTLEKDDLADLVRESIAPRSWDEDPRTHLLISRCPTLLVNQAPWVLDDIEALIDALR